MDTDLASAAGGQHGDRGHEAAHAVASLVQHIGAQAVPHAADLVPDQVCGQVVLEEGDVGVRPCCCHQRALNLTPCETSALMNS